MSEAPGSNVSQLFVVVSTENGIANIPPILARMRSGDKVVWLESSRANEARWTNGPRGLLAGRGISDQRSVALPDDPEAWSASLPGELAVPGFKTVFVGNGGTKPMSQALQAIAGAAAASNGAGFETIYSDEQPARFWVMEGGGARVRKPLRERLKFVEIIKSNGFIVKNLQPGKDRQAICFWPDDYDLTMLFSPGSENAAYGVDRDRTGAYHDRIEQYCTVNKARDALNCRDLPGFEAAQIALPDRAETVRARLERGSHDPAGLFNAVKNIVRDTAKKIDQTEPTSRESIGWPFEVAVARRLQAWLNANRDRVPVCEAWLGPKIARTASDDALKQFDVVLVIRNGILLELECKSYDAERQDLNAKLLNLKRSGGRALMYVCAPIYTAFCDRAWFATSVKLREAVKGLFGFIGFTLPGQPENYAWDGDVIPCPTFEEGLDDIIAPFCPAGIMDDNGGAPAAGSLLSRAEAPAATSAAAQTKPPQTAPAPAPPKPSPPSAAPGRLTGTVTSWQGTHGFILCDERGDTIVVHHEEWVGAGLPESPAGTRVSFETERGRNKLRAVNLQPIGG